MARPPNPPRVRGLTLSASASAAVRRGHPWVFADQVTAGLRELEVGEVASVFDPTGARLGGAIVDPGSPIAARVWTRDPTRSVDDALVRSRIERAMRLRDGWFDDATTAYRWLHGEGDRTPGLVVDRYGEVAVMRLDGAAMIAWADRLAELVWPFAQARGVRSLSLRVATRGAGKLETVRGALPSEANDGSSGVVVREHGVPFLVDVVHGQKTGAFLDQRDNRRRVGGMAKGRRVLNLFSYTGGFSLHAALGGASACTSVDVAAGAHATAQRSFALAGVSLDAHRFVTADVFRFLEGARSRGEQWDLVISDPPNMAPNEASRARALTAYRQLHAACAAVLADGGALCAASCSSHVSLEDFLGTLDDATLGRDDLRVIEIAGAGADHPVIPAFPQGRYLKFVVLS